MTKLEDSISTVVERLLSDWDVLEFKDKVQILDRAMKWASHLSKKGGKGKFGEGLDTDDTED